MSLYASGASALRVRLRRDPGGALSLAAADGVGVPVMSVGSLVLRPVTAGQRETAAGGLRDALFTVEWVPVATDGAAAGRWAVAGEDDLGLAAGLAAAGLDVRAYPGLAALAEAVGTGEPAPEMVMACTGAGVTGDGVAEAARVAAGSVLEVGARVGLAEERLALARLVLVTAGAVAARPGEGVAVSGRGGGRGLVRSAQSENPGRLVLADLPPAGGPEVLEVLAAGMGSGEPELAVRDGAVYGRRLAYPDPGLLVPPRAAGPWRLDVAGRGTLDNLTLVSCPEAAGLLAAGQVRAAPRAAGLNFRDVLIGLDMYPGGGVPGSEIAAW